MRVVFETTALYTARAGVARYVSCLLQELQKLKESNLEIQPLAWEVTNYEYRQPERSLKTLYRELIWAKFLAPRTIRALQPDVFHSTCSVLVRPPPNVRHVVTMTDMTVLRYPERFRKWARLSEIGRLKYVHDAEAVICISTFTASEVMELLNIPASRITVIPCGSPFHPELGEVIERVPCLNIPQEFFLFVSSLEPGKNLKLLRSVYELASSRKIRLPPLLIVGARRPGVEGEGNAPANWHYLGYQMTEQLVYLYRRALALVFPSKYEGFGLPVIEAMTLGCPVICSPVASLPEVGGDAAYFVDLNPESYLQALRKLLGDSILRNDFVAKGREQSLKFSWRRCAEQTAAIYHKVRNS